jgi:hypothetical protein
VGCSDGGGVYAAHCKARYSRQRVNESVCIALFSDICPLVLLIILSSFPSFRLFGFPFASPILALCIVSEYYYYHWYHSLLPNGPSPCRRGDNVVVFSKRIEEAQLTIAVGYDALSHRLTMGIYTLPEACRFQSCCP